MGSLDPRAVKKVSGPSWEPLKRQFDEICDSLLAVSQDAAGELTTIYVKFQVVARGPVYAVMWVRRSSELVVGLSLPDGVRGAHLYDPPRSMKYPGLTRYFTVRHGDDVPSELREWARISHENVGGTVADKSPS